jgi:hypothetical protein
MGQLATETSRVADCRLVLTPQRRLWLERLDRDAGALLEHLSRRPTRRLGVYFEQLWHFFLEQDPGTELVAHNLPVHQEGRTLGEFDCIYYCHQRKQHIHLELAVKFYLAAPHPGHDRGDGSQWLGPDTRDRLDLKLSQLLQRQIVLGDHPRARHLLEGLGVVQPAREIAFKGYLFQPLAARLPPPPGYNARRAMNDWLVPGQLAAYCDGLAAQAFECLPKKRWLCAAMRDTPDDLISAAELEGAVGDYFRASAYPLLVAALDSSGVEVTRFFVVPEAWPERES